MDENRRTFEFAARFACEKGIARYTRFLDPVQEAEARQIACDCGAVFASWGGYEQAERKIGCFLPWGEEALRVNFPLVTRSSWLFYGFGLDKRQYWRYYHSRF